MCGIVGYIGGKSAGPILLECLRKLEYRGYDSAGIATIKGNEILVKKDVGKIDEIDKIHDLGSIKGNVGISHCRWATHGKVTKNNAHPHGNIKNTISIVHNGIIENYQEIKKKLKEKGYKFSSDTDTEVIAHLIDSFYSGSIKDAVLSAMGMLEGSYALAIICSDEPELLIAARNDSPLVLGIGNGENFISSDVYAIMGHTRKVMYLENKELAVLSKERIWIYNSGGKEIKKKLNTIEWDAKKAEKLGFDHFMLKEIFEQPDTIADTLDGKIGEDSISLDIGLTNSDIKKIKRIIIVACGTSWHAALTGEFMIEELAKIPVEVEYASEFRYRDPIIEEGTIVMAISQSGETADTLAAIREARKKKAMIVSIVNVEGSSIARESDVVIYTKVGPEIGVASTKAFTSQLVTLYLMTIHFGAVRGEIDEQQVRNRIRDIRLIPAQVRSILEEHGKIKKLAEVFFKKENTIYLGRGINFPIALEGALKLKEVSYIHAEGYPAAEMKHGPIALIDKNMPVVVIATQDTRTYKKVMNNIEEVKSRGGILIAIETKGDEETKKHVDHNLYVPRNSYILTPVLAVVPLQLFAYYMAVLRGCDVDKPRNLAKAVVVE